MSNDREFRQRWKPGSARREKRLTSKERKKPLPSGAGTLSTADNFALIEEVGLFFRIQPDAFPSLMFRAEGPLPGGLAASVQVFRDTFKAVWEKLPLGDRERILHFWRQGYEGLVPVERDPSNSPRPLIQIVSGPLPSSPLFCERLGHEINIPAALLGRRSLLVRQLANILAQVHRLMTREHWRLVLERYMEPLERWERKEGNTASDARWDRKIDALEAGYFREYWAQIDAILRNWGFEEMEGVREKLPAC